MSLNGKTIYAQSSDIKSRTYLQYRKDMKKKAIAELEVLDWLKVKLPEFYRGKQVEVRKTGGDAFIWFLREGGITRECDFMANVGGKEIEFEFQYADKADLDFYDFKVSKVTKKQGAARIPHQGKKFVYIMKPTLQYAVFDCQWIVDNGEYGMVPAWRSYAYRVPREDFQAVLQRDESLRSIVKMIDIKNDFLDFQSQLLEMWRDEFSYLLQSVIDEEKILSIIPRDLDSFFKVVFVLDSLQRKPKNASLWLMYLLSYINNRIDTNCLAKLIYCTDFLYSKVRLEEHELQELISKVKELLDFVHSIGQRDGTYKSSLKISPLEETRNALFSINLLEDIVQDMIYYYNTNLLKPVQKIFENVTYLEQTFGIIHQNEHGNQSSFPTPE